MSPVPNAMLQNLTLSRCLALLSFALFAIQEELKEREKRSMEEISPPACLL